MAMYEEAQQSPTQDEDGIEYPFNPATAFENVQRVRERTRAGELGGR
jgi:hypothetical protein